MLPWKVDLKTDNIGNLSNQVSQGNLFGILDCPHLLMNTVMINSPCCLRGTNVAAVNVVGDLVYIVFKASSITAFVDVFEGVLDRFERGDTFSIDVTIILGRKVWDVWDNHRVVHHLSSDIVGPTIVATLI